MTAGCRAVDAISACAVLSDEGDGRALGRDPAQRRVIREPGGAAVRSTRALGVARVEQMLATHVGPVPGPARRKALAALVAERRTLLQDAYAQATAVSLPRLRASASSATRMSTWRAKL